MPGSVRSRDCQSRPFKLVSVTCWLVMTKDLSEVAVSIWGVSPSTTTVSVVAPSSIRREPEVQRLIHVEDEILLLQRLHAGGGNFDGVPAGSERSQPEDPIRAADRFAHHE